MTNLFLLAICVTTNMITNSVSITCEDAQCTNWQTGTLEVQLTPRQRCEYHQRNADRKVPAGLSCECIAATHKTEEAKFCQFWHSKPLIYPAAILTKYCIGTRDGPLFSIYDQNPVPAPAEAARSICITGGWHLDGVFLGRESK